VEGAIGGPTSDGAELGSGAKPSRDWLRVAIGGAIICVALAGALIAVYRDRHTFVETIKHIGPEAVAASALCGLLGVACTYLVWREVLAGLGIDLPFGSGARVFYTSQLGKYVPGSVWPVVMQMEAGKARGASRRTMLGANLTAIVLSCTGGLVVAAILLPAYDAHALAHYWWALLFLPFLLALLHPRALPALMDRVFLLLHRPALDERLDARHEARAFAWSLPMWLGLGVHLAILAGAASHWSVSIFLLCIGGMALAMSLGVLFIPAPAGAGVRDVILVLVLGSVMSSSQALAVVVTSRATLIACDVAIAGLAAATVRRGRTPVPDAT
jgi:glycosyltransferase 2 family protein